MTQKPTDSAPAKAGSDLLPRERPGNSDAIKIPQISLPKGGGALKGIDEKFRVNPATGTASFSIPLPFSPNRNGFTPSLSLSYSSTAGNSLFGIGWDLDLPAIQRRTDQKLPRYRDAHDVSGIPGEDSFMFSGVEELVPFLDWEKSSQKWTVRQTENDHFIIRQYRSRVEGAFSRIERIFDKGRNCFYWRVTSRENITTFFGYSSECRIADPEDERKIFRWLPEFSYDDKGSWIEYGYKPEDLTNVSPSLYEKNRLEGIARFANRHLKYIRYGNEAATYFEDSPYQRPLLQNEKHFFTLVLDYGEHNKENPLTDGTAPWPSRRDPYSSCRSGFEIRTYRLCKRVLMFHHFPQSGGDVLVRSLSFDYRYADFYGHAEIPDPGAEMVYLTAVTQSGHIRDNQGYSSKSLPPLTFDYQWLSWNKTVKEISAEDLVHAPEGISAGYQWTDLYSEGINGILTEQAEAWFYKSNLGDGRFSPARLIMPKPSFTGLGEVLQLQDLDADGRKQLVVTSPGIQGYFELDDEGEWQPFRTFIKNLHLDLSDPNVRMLDVDGDGRPEVLLSDAGAFWWWGNQGKAGYDSPESAVKAYDEERGAAIIFEDPEQRIFLADMTGDGLTDLVRIRNGEICYWANRGYGRFGAKVTMGHSPVFDHPDQFDPANVQLADISGTGTTDIIYLGRNQFKAYLNCSGNRWAEGEPIDPFFPAGQPHRITVTDLLGNGTACLVWSSGLPAYYNAPMRYIDLMGGVKPHLMKSHENGMGKKTEIAYRSSTYYYLEDQRKGEPWLTRLAFPVHVVSGTTVTERVTNVRFSSQYAYHHGYYDHAEREFRGFGRVDQLDAEAFDVFAKTEAGGTVPEAHYQPPVLTKTWFDNGYTAAGKRITDLFKQEYWQNSVRMPELPDNRAIVTQVPDGFNPETLTPGECREALRTCKGMILRQEVFAVEAYSDFKNALVNIAAENGRETSDFDVFRKIARDKDLVPYSVAMHSCGIRLLQSRGPNRFGAFLIMESESMTQTYERNAEDPRITHTLNLETDDLGNVLQSISATYPKRMEDPLLTDAAGDTPETRQAKKHGREAQQKSRLTLTINDFTPDITEPGHYYLRKSWQTRAYELTGISPLSSVFSVSELKETLPLLEEIPYSGEALYIKPEKRLLEHVRTTFYDHTLAYALPDGQIGRRGIPYGTWRLAYTSGLLADIFSPFLDITSQDLSNAGFQQTGSNWWGYSGTVSYRLGNESFDEIKTRFFSPTGYFDPFGSKTEVFYDALHLFMKRSVDALGNETEVVAFDYRTLTPLRIKDPNDNFSSVITDELGLVKAAASEGKVSANSAAVPEGDHLGGMISLTAPAEQDLVRDFFAVAGTPAPAICDYSALQNHARQLLGNASVRMLYDFSRQPAVVAGIVREQHKSAASPLQISFEYTDGFGKVAMQKIQAEPGKVRLPDGSETGTGSQLRWIGNGRTVLNNKGNPIRQYEPYFSTTPAYENDPGWVLQGVSPTLFYDGAGRNIRTEFPNGTVARTEFDAWKQHSWDVNDTIEESSWKNNPDNADAYARALHHAGTPSTLFLDTLGQPVLGREHNRWTEPDGSIGEAFYYTCSDTDIEGNVLSITDARGQRVMAWRYDMAGRRVAESSMDYGRRWSFLNTVGNPVKTLDERGNIFTFTYDVLQRPEKRFLLEPGSAVPLLAGLTRYGEEHPDAVIRNLRGKILGQCEGSGETRTLRYDFKGNILEVEKQMPADPKSKVPDWHNAQLDATVYTKITEYDALNRMTRLYNWHYNDLTRGTRVTVHEPVYSPRSILQSEDLIIDAQKNASSYTGGNRQTIVRDILYDAKGQRLRIRYGNDIVTCYHYDPLTFRLVQLRTTKNGNDDCRPGARSNLNDAHTFQDLFYTYDPAGNIAGISDEAYEPVFFSGQMVLPKNTYTYDALYRLTEATGREQSHLGAPQQKDHGWPATTFAVTDKTLQNYTQRFTYDAAGNFLKTQHQANTGSWTRHYQYAARSNRLLATQTGSTPAYDFYTDTPTLSDKYEYDAHGNTLRTGNTPAELLTWDHQDMLQQYEMQGGGHAWYQYDSGKVRSRKYIEKSGIIEERLYLGGMERYRRWRNGTLEEEIETLHVLNSGQRILLVENVLQTNHNSLAAGVLQRYQFGNHLGSTTLELNQDAEIISYEEYHPYGTTAYQAQNVNIKAAAKRYRFTGMERDEESGFAYHSARYYMPWLGRWLSADPIGVKGGINLYAYCSGEPVKNIDITGNDEWCGLSDGFFGLFDSDCHLAPRVAGGIKMVGGVLETAGGAALTVTTAPACVSVAGCVVPAAGVGVTLHGIDTTISGARTMWEGEDIDSFTSQGLQGLGMSRGAANLTDAGISVVGSLGANVVTRAPGVATAGIDLTRPSLTVSHAAGAPSALGVTNPLGYAVGHTRIGVTLGDETATVWTHLTVPGERVMMSGGALVKSGEAVISTGTTLAPKFASVATVPVNASEAQAAMAFVRASTGSAGPYAFLANDCATYGSRVLSAGGVTASGATPSTLLISTALRSEAPVTTLLSSATVMQPATTASMAVNMSVGIISMSDEEPPHSSYQDTYDYSEEVCYEDPELDPSLMVCQ